MAGAIGILEDISIQKRMEENSRKSEEKFKVIFESANDGILVADPETGLVIMGNQQMATMAQHRQDRLIGLNLQEIFPDNTPIKVEQILEESLRLLRASIPSYIDIQWEIHENLRLINVDPTQIQQVIINLCTNASHAIADTPGVLMVRLKEIELTSTTFKGYKSLPAGSYVQLTVSDTGHGIDPSIVDRIFDPYFTTKEVGKGTGMGLAVVHGIVAGHDRALTLYSEPGKGTVIRVLFPTVEAKPIRKAEIEKDIPKGVGRILFIDDEAALVRMTVQILERLGYTIEAFTDPRTALDHFLTNPDAFDLVITDMTMLGMTGDLLARKIGNLRPDLPIILCTGFSQHLAQNDSPPAGIKKIIEKPVNVRLLAKTIQKLLAKKLSS